jgi:hypothetical protein
MVTFSVTEWVRLPLAPRMVMVPDCVPKIVGSVLATMERLAVPGTETLAGVIGQVAVLSEDDAAQVKATVPVKPWIALRVTDTDAGVVKLDVATRTDGSATKSG